MHLEMVECAVPEHVRTSIRAKIKRPILHHLNADTSWLLQVPQPSISEKQPRAYFNILFDPWLSGTQSDVTSWFSTQWHAIKPAYSSIAAVDALCRAVEVEALGTANVVKPDSFIDAVAISHEFTDHCHKATLLELPQNVPVFAAAEAAKLIRSWKHFSTVVEQKNIGENVKSFRDVNKTPLPDWLAICRLQNEKDGLYYHSATVVLFKLSGNQTDGQVCEAVIYTPHGVHPNMLSRLTSSPMGIRPLALLHGLHDVWLNWRQQLNLGAHNGLMGQRLLKAQYWLGTHDEVKHGRGVVSWFLRRRQISVEEALDKERKQNGSANGALDSVRYRELGNGESLVLEFDVAEKA